MECCSEAGSQLEAGLLAVDQAGGVDAADRGGEQELVGGRDPVERQALLTRGMKCEHSRADRAGQLTTVQRRCYEMRALHDEEVRVCRLENVAVEVEDERHRVESLGQLVEQTTVAPLV